MTRAGSQVGGGKVSGSAMSNTLAGPKSNQSRVGVLSHAIDIDKDSTQFYTKSGEHKLQGSSHGGNRRPST